MADVLREKTGADIAFVGGLQADLKKGEITVGDIYKILPIIHKLEVLGFNVAVVELTGEEIKDTVEHSVGWVLDNSQGGTRHILQVSGLNFAYDPKAPIYQRIKEVSVNGEDLKPDRVYRVAVNGYLAAGGNRYYNIQFAENRWETGLMAFDVLVEYVKIHSSITAPPLAGRIVRIE